MKRVALWLYLISCGVTSNAQYPYFRVINTSNGLAQNTVSVIRQDSRGYMWIVSQEGLQRYDGYNFKTYRYDPNNPSGLLTNNIREVFIDAKDNVWMVSNMGITILDPATDKMEHLTTKKGKWKLSAESAACIAQTHDGKIIIGYSEAVVDVIDLQKPGEVFTIRSDDKNENGLCRGPISAVVVDKNKNWWFSSWGDGICMYNPTTKTFTNYRESGTRLTINYNAVRSIFCDSKNRIWISNWNAGNCVLEQNPLKVYDCRVDNSKYGKFRVGLVWNFDEDSRGTIWAATAEDGVTEFHPEKKIFRKHKGHPELPRTLPGNHVLCMIADKNDLIWCGCWSGGIGVYNPNKQFVYSYRHVSDDPTCLGGNLVISIHQGRSGKIWVGTGTGNVAQFDPVKGIFIPIEIAASSEEQLNNRISIQSIYEDTKGNLWLGTNGTGLLHYSFSTKSLKNFNKPGSQVAPAGVVHTCITGDKDDHIWIGSSGNGISVWDPVKEKFYYYRGVSRPDSLHGIYITSLWIDSKNNVWIATGDAGLNRYNAQTKKFTNYRSESKKGSLGSDLVYSVLVDSRQNLWVGSTSGLSRQLPDGSFKTYTMRDGLGNNVILSMVEDKSGKLWMGTNSGTSLLNIQTEKFQNFSLLDGFQAEYNQNAICRLRDGRILFGGIDGLTMVVPARVTKGKQKAEVYFTDLQVLNKPYLALDKNISYQKEITLSYRDYLFSLDFATSDYTDPTRVKFKYLLEGFDHDWVDLGNKHSVSFTNIAAGTYTLKVLATNSEGIWSNNPAELSITITPPFWRTTWFYILCGVIIVLSAYGYLRLRERNLRKEKQLLEEKVEERTVELRHEKEKVEEAHREIKDSINYAKRIQESILPDDAEIKKVLTEFFILFHPKDVVSGDFFWHYRIPNTQQVLIAAADCTGHGVPGAFMSMIGNTLLNEIVIQNKQYQPNEILNQLHVGVRKALQQDRSYSDSRDGMDICLCHVDLTQKRVLYAGANRPLLILRNKEFIDISPDKMPIGGLQTETRREFTCKEEKLQSGDKLYLFSDGIIDQFGGEKGKKFKVSRLREKLLEYSVLTMPEQKQRMDDEFRLWKGNYEQTDDICLIGISIN